jgi:hypothetical protein
VIAINVRGFRFHEEIESSKDAIDFLNGVMEEKKDVG